MLLFQLLELVHEILEEACNSEQGLSARLLVAARLLFDLYK